MIILSVLHNLCVSLARFILFLYLQSHIEPLQILPRFVSSGHTHAHVHGLTHIRVHVRTRSPRHISVTLVVFVTRPEGTRTQIHRTSVHDREMVITCDRCVLSVSYLWYLTFLAISTFFSPPDSFLRHGTW